MRWWISRHRRTLRARIKRSGQRRSRARTWPRLRQKSAGKQPQELGRDVVTFQREDGVAENFHTEQNRDLLETACVADRRTLLEALRPEGSAARYLVLRGRHLCPRHQGTVEHADRVSVFAWTADRRVAAAAKVGCGMKRALLETGLRIVIFATAFSFTSLAHAAVYYVTVAGLGGEPDYEQRFTAAAKDLDKVFKAADSTAHVSTLTGAQATASQLRETLDAVARDAKADDDFVLILIGHGSFDGVEYKFNLVGPDVTAGEIAAMCDRIPTRRQLIVNTTSASGGAVRRS